MVKIAGVINPYWNRSYFNEVKICRLERAYIVHINPKHNNTIWSLKTICIISHLAEMKEVDFLSAGTSLSVFAAYGEKSPNFKKSIHICINIPLKYSIFFAVFWSHMRIWWPVFFFFFVLCHFVITTPPHFLILYANLKIFVFFFTYSRCLYINFFYVDKQKKYQNFKRSAKNPQILKKSSKNLHIERNPQKNQVHFASSPPMEKSNFLYGIRLCFVCAGLC